VSETQIPEASFTILLSTLASQAAVALGKIPLPGEETTNTDLTLAKHLVDMLSVLDEKTKGNLTEDEAKLMQQSLHQLRMLYVQVDQETE
jgi:uncharacterized membrane protein YgcG